MRDIAVVGGVGSGKTTFSEALISVDSGYHRVYMGKYNVMIPMTLIATSCPSLLSFGKDEYIRFVIDNSGIELIDFPRHELDEYLVSATKTYGETIAAEMGWAACIHTKPNVIDGVPGVENVRYLKKRGVFMVGLSCEPDIRMKRRLQDKKPMDPKDEDELMHQIKSTDDLYQLQGILGLADIVFDTDESGFDYTEHAKEVIFRL